MKNAAPRNEEIQRLLWAFGTLKSAVTTINTGEGIAGCEVPVAEARAAAGRQIDRLRASLIALELLILPPEEPALSRKEPTRSELRTLKTRAQEGLRVAQQNLTSVGIIRDGLDRKSGEYRIAAKCYDAVKATFDQQDAIVKELEARQKVVGNYGKKNKGGGS